ncbi:hypothetical protein LIER_43708 [Lithospermum erythrorhizon]|uniref:Uncharacterized protein n=1 Tax=Lithospermum erythrorhizon TaxID=34254 RepID=A0AAV3QMD2_LITER
MTSKTKTWLLKHIWLYLLHMLLSLRPLLLNEYDRVTTMLANESPQTMALYSSQQSAPHPRFTTSRPNTTSSFHKTKPRSAGILGAMHGAKKDMVLVKLTPRSFSHVSSTSLILHSLAT